MTNTHASREWSIVLLPPSDKPPDTNGETDTFNEMANSVRHASYEQYRHRTLSRGVNTNQDRTDYNTSSQNYYHIYAFPKHIPIRYYLLYYF